MPFDLIETVASLHPLKTQAQFRTVHHGASVAEIVAGFDLDMRFGLPQVHLVRGGDLALIPMDLWGKVRPKPGTRVEVSYAVEGPLIPLAAAALSAAAPWIATSVFGLAAGTLSYTVAVAAITVVGGLMLNALIPPVSQPKRDMEQYVITGIQNMENRYGIYPKVLGRHRIYPPKTARGYTETVGRDIFYRGRMSFGWGPVALEDLRIGTTPIHEFDDVEVEFLNVNKAQTLANYPELAGITKAWRTGTETLTLCPDDVAEDGYNVRLLQGGAVTRVTRERTESASVDVAFPQGLIAHTAKGGPVTWTVAHSIRWRPLGGAWVNAGILSNRAQTTSYIRYTKVITFPAPGEYEIEVTRTTPDSDLSRDSFDSYLSAIRSFRSGNLPSHDGIAEVAFRLRASEQLSGNVDSLNAVTQQMAPIWTGSGWTAPQPVRHPAWVYLAAIRGSHLRRPVPDSRIDLAAFKAWADEEPHWTCDYVIDAETRTAEVLDIIAASGRARRALTDLQYSIIRDGAAGPVRQMFSPRNSWGFKGSIAFPRPIHALRCMVRSERLDWEQDEVTVYADGYDATTATEFETLDLPGVVVTKASEDEGTAWRLGRYHLAQAILRPETFEWHADWEHMRVTRGDKVQLVHDVPVIGVGAARAKAVAERIGWRFRDSDEGWGADQATITPSANSIIIEQTGYDPKLRRGGLSFSGGRFNRVVLDIERVADRVVGRWDGRLFWSTQGGHGEHASYNTRFPDLAVGTRRRIVLDLAQPDQGGTDWISSTITGLRIDFDNGPTPDINPGGAWRVYGISVISAEVSDITSAASGTFIELDEMFDMAADQFRLTARAEDGSRHSVLAQAPVDPATRLWQIVGEVVPGTIQRGDLVFIEEVAQESMEVLVTGIYPDGDGARITAVPAAPAVLLADQGAIPPYAPIITPGRNSALRGPDLPVVLSIISNESTMLVASDNSVQARIAVTLEPILTAGELGAVQLRWRPAGGDDAWVYGDAQPIGNTAYLTAPVQRGTSFEVAVRTISGTGRSRGWVAIGSVLARGTEAPPPDVTGFTIVPVEQQVQLRWDDVEDIPDIALAEIRYSAAEGADWNASVLLERMSYPMVTARLFARAGTYLIKWVDWEGRYSLQAASAHVSTNQIMAQNAVETYEVSPAWTGAPFGTEVAHKGALVLPLTGGTYPEYGHFQAGQNIDLGAVYPVQITPHIQATGLSIHDTMASWTSLAALPSLAASSPDAWRVELDVRVSEDTPFSGTWQPISGGTFVGRHFSFRVRLYSLREDVTPQVDFLAFVLDMPDRVEGVEDVLCPAAGMRITYDPAFRNIPSVVATPREAPSGARLVVGAKSRTGFDIRFYNSAGTAIAQRFDWVARGYGREAE